jgi:Leucine-rich repeat (LRR) protein
MLTTTFFLSLCLSPGLPQNAVMRYSASEAEAVRRIEGPMCTVEWSKVGNEMRVVAVTFGPGPVASGVTVKLLHRFRHLQKVDFSVCDITPRELAGLCKHRSLDTLILDSNRSLGDLSMRYCQHLPNLRVLSLRSTSITDTAVKALEGLRKLRWLDLSSNYDLTDDALRSIRLLPALQVLNVSSTEITDRGVAHLRNLDLQELNLGLTQITDRAVRDIVTLAKLRRLVLGATAITDRGIQHLVKCKHLAELGLYGTDISNTGLLLLSRCSRLQLLSIGGNKKITDDGLRAVAALPQLESLSLLDAPITDRGLAHLTKCRRLKWLNLEGTLITKACLPTLRKLTTLTDLLLHGTNISDEQVKVLALSLPRTRIQYAFTKVINPPDHK